MNGFKKPGSYPYVLCLMIVLFQGNWLYSQQGPVIQKTAPKLIDSPVRNVLQFLPSSMRAKAKTTTTAKNTATAMAMAIDDGPEGPAGAGNSLVPPVLFPSPNSATLTRLISDNADLYTGRYNVDIP